MTDLYRTWRISMLVAAVLAAAVFLIAIGAQLVAYVLSIF
ncbi:hypothetical protein GCM10027589_48990 [Actinocorallia lasiicapitis]